MSVGGYPVAFKLRDIVIIVDEIKDAVRGMLCGACLNSAGEGASCPRCSALRALFSKAKNAVEAGGTGR